eukprot:TRINITY_DN59580_c0_g1_i3.p1 TRINITY_DN59580_c0_g1~~TRINITY_DN59580_c0_g1_i3.p1  ORF type:complete len:485 (-),score=76.88 TRINITY_DN59580_c0_g1_i3:154-1608(-)
MLAMDPLVRGLVAAAWSPVLQAQTVLHVAAASMTQLRMRSCGCSKRSNSRAVGLSTWRRSVHSAATATCCHCALLGLKHWRLLTKGRAQVAAWAEDGRRKEVYRKLKAALRSALQAGPDGEVVVANAGPRPAKRHWHSFAPPEYAGDLDPKVAAVQGILDKLQHADTVTMSGEEFAVLRVAGDRFLPQQVRRLVATALCVQRGWLPSDFFLTATRPDVVVSTPVAPEGLLYLEECKFTFWEYRHGPLFAAGSCEGSKDWTASLQRRIAARWAAEDGVGKFEAWLQHMEKVDVPRIRAQLERIRMADAFANGDWRPPKPLHDCAGFPGAYEECLRLLREVHASGRWPESSLARGKLIRPGEGGSFSVGQTGEQQKVPKGNLAFPELTRAVFELERLIAPAGRPPSAMVAINHNAQFIPHIDSGAGLGQSQSLIVGLGAYAGGELAVEGAIHDIRYKPLEFNGWKQRHWTLPFDGERFSLVWFTPA